MHGWVGRCVQVGDIAYNRQVIEQMQSEPQRIHARPKYDGWALPAPRIRRFLPVMRVNPSRRALSVALLLGIAPAFAAPKPARRTAPKKPSVAKPTAAPALPADSSRSGRAATDSWPMFRGNPRHTAFSPMNVKLPLTPAWTWQGDAYAISSSPVIVDGTVFIGTRDDIGMTKGSLIAIDLASGKLKWRYNTSDKGRTIMTHSAKVQPPSSTGANAEALSWVDSTPSVVGNMVYVMSRDGALHALTTSGALKWRLRTGGLDMGSPTVVNGTVFIGSGYPNKDFWAVEAATGVVKWRTNSGLPDPLLKRPGQYVYSSQAYSDGVVYGAANDGGFYAVDATTGKLKWRYETQGGVYFHSPTVADDVVIGAPGDYDTAVYAISRANGDLKWKYDSGFQHSYVSSPAFDGNNVYVGVGEPNQTLVALDVQTGKLKWKYVTGYATQTSYTSSPAVTNNVIFVGTAQPKQGDPESGRLVALDKATGSVLWQAALPKQVLSSPAVAGNYVVVGCMDGTVRAFTWTP